MTLRFNAADTLPRAVANARHQTLARLTCDEQKAVTATAFDLGSIQPVPG